MVYDIKSNSDYQLEPHHINSKITSSLTNIDVDFIDEEDLNHNSRYEHKQFLQPEESIYREIFNEYNTKIKLYYKQLLKFARKNKKLFTIYVLFSISFLFLLFKLLNDNHPVSIIINDPIKRTPLHKIIIPHLKDLYPEDISSNYDDSLFDSRLAPAMLLLLLQNHLLKTNHELEKDFTIPFSWDDWLDFNTRLSYDNSYLIDWLNLHSDSFIDHINDFFSLNCESFATLYGCEGNVDFQNHCVNSDDDILGYPYKFKITGPTSAKIKENGRVLYGSSYIKCSMPPPDRIYLLNLFENDEVDGGLMINIDKNIKREPFLRNKEKIKEYTDKYINLMKFDKKVFFKNGLNIESLKRTLSKYFSYYGVEKKIPTNKQFELIDRDETFLAFQETSHKMKSTKWETEDFLWDELSFLNNLNYISSQKDEDNYDAKLYKTINELENFKIYTGGHPKYLQEANLYSVTLGSHFDWRFFSGSYILNDFRQSVIHRLARTWLRFCYENHLKTFIAYGSMLGWIRNGLTLPWDGDIDVIVTMKTLHILARNFNNTLVVDYSSKDGFQTSMSSYLIDINPTYYSRVHGSGLNAIDGRFIDINTGIYLDISALAWTKNYLKDLKIPERSYKIVDKDYEFNIHSAGDHYEETLKQKLNEYQESKQLIHCKNDNPYLVDELSKMVPSFFEGVRAYFPSEYEKLIWRLYPSALTRITEPDHIFDKKYRLWINKYDCPDLNENEESTFGKCENREVLQQFELTREYTARHFNMIEEKKWDQYEFSKSSETLPFRIDEFFLIYGNRLGISEEQVYNYYVE